MHESAYLFTSARLGFRRWQPDDLTPFAALNADAEAMAFFPHLLSWAESEQMIARLEDTFVANGFTFFAVETLHDQRFMGFIGLIKTNFEAWFTPCIEIGWRLKKSAWGQGYATEGAAKCLAWGFETFGFQEVFSFTACLNTRSERIMQKIGMEKMGTFAHPKLAPGHPLTPHVLYRIQRPA